ncbi:MAG: carboxylesterase family protein [Planctomycetota bacterium]|jgi:dienelactone hydrolase
MIRRLSILVILLALVPPKVRAGEVDDPVRAFFEDPANKDRIASIRADMARCYEAGGGQEADAMKRLEALEGVPFGVFERLLGGLGGGSDDATGTLEIPFVVEDDKQPTRMAVFVPEDYDANKKWPLMVTLHGHAGLCEQMLRWYTPHARKHGFIIAATQAHTKYASEGWASTQPERSNPISALEVMKKRYNIDPDRVILGGCCMGGHGTWEVGMLYADRFVAAYPTIGGPRIINFAYIENMLNLPFFTYVGLQDQALLVWNIQKAVKMLEKVGADIRLVEYPDRGHDVVAAEDPLFFEWLGDRRRKVYPKKVIWYVNHMEHRRAYWAEIDSFKGEPFDPYLNKKVKIRRKPRGEHELREMYIASIRKKTPGLSAEIVRGNKIKARCRGLKKISFYLSDRLLDLDKKVFISVNGKTRYKEVPKRSVRFLIEHASATNDTGRAFACKVTVDAR